MKAAASVGISCQRDSESFDGNPDACFQQPDLAPSHAQGKKKSHAKLPSLACKFLSQRSCLRHFDFCLGSMILAPDACDVYRRLRQLHVQILESADDDLRDSQVTEPLVI